MRAGAGEGELAARRRLRDLRDERDGLARARRELEGWRQEAGERLASSRAELAESVALNPGDRLLAEAIVELDEAAQRASASYEAAKGKLDKRTAEVEDELASARESARGRVPGRGGGEA